MVDMFFAFYGFPIEFRDIMHKIWNILLLLTILKWCVTFLYVLLNQSYDCMNWNVSRILHVHDMNWNVSGILHVHDKKVVVWTRPIGLKVREGLHLKPKNILQNFFVWDQFSQSSDSSLTSMTSIFSIFHDFKYFNLLNLGNLPWLQWLEWL